MLKNQIRDIPRPSSLEEETDEIKASVNEEDFLENVPVPSNEVPSPSFEPDFPENEKQTIQGYQQANTPYPTQAFSPTPSYLSQQLTSTPELMGRSDIERIQQLAESIIHEKWEEFNKKVGNIELWKEKVDTNITSLKQELIRTQHRFENVEKAVLNKVTDFNKSMESVTTEIKALEKAMEKIVEPLTSSIKELKKLTEELKKK